MNLPSNKHVDAAIEKYEQFYGREWDEVSEIPHLWPEDNTFCLVDTVETSNYLSNKWQEDQYGNLKESESAYIAYTHEHDEPPQPKMYAVSDSGKCKTKTRKFKRPSLLALSFLGFALDFDLKTLDSNGEPEHIDYKHNSELPYLCWWEAKKALVVFNARNIDTPIIVTGPNLRVGPRGIEG